MYVDPGGTCPVRAVSTPPASGPFDTASTAPSLIRIATIELGSFCLVTAWSAAFWMAVSRVILMSLPSTGLEVKTGFSVVVSSAASAETTTDSPGAPRSSLSYFSCSPPCPTWSPTVNSVGRLSRSSLVAGSTAPSRARAKTRVGASWRVSSRKTVPGNGRTTSRILL